MGFEAGFFAGYALLLVGVAAGLHRLGKVNTTPWRSRTLGGYRRQHPVPEPPPTGEADWPHSEAGRVYTLVALVTTLAAVTLLIVGLARNHRPVEIAVLGAAALTATATSTALARAFMGKNRARRRA